MGIVAGMTKEKSTKEPGMLVCRHQSFKLAAEAFQDKLLK